MFTEIEERVYDVLKTLEISYVRHEHPPVYTVEQAEKHWEGISGAHCKNLFLRNKKGTRHYLVILGHKKNVDLRTLTRLLGEDRLSFASEKRMMRFLGLEPGSVSPFGLIHDEKKEVQVILDLDLKNVKKINFHPNVNTATLTLDFTDFEKFLAWQGKITRFLKVGIR